VTSGVETESPLIGSASEKKNGQVGLVWIREGGSGKCV